MMQIYLPVGTKVRVNESAAYLAGRLAYILEVEPGTEFPYCVHTHRETNNVTDSQWLRMSDVVSVVPVKTEKVKAGRILRRKSTRPAIWRIKAGSKVTVDPLVPFGLRSGVVQEVLNGAALLTSDHHIVSDGNIWIRLKYLDLA